MDAQPLLDDNQDPKKLISSLRSAHLSRPHFVIGIIIITIILLALLAFALYAFYSYFANAYAAEYVQCIADKGLYCNNSPVGPAVFTGFIALFGLFAIVGIILLIRLYFGNPKVNELTTQQEKADLLVKKIQEIFCSSNISQYLIHVELCPELATASSPEEIIAILRTQTLRQLEWILGTTEKHAGDVLGFDQAVTQAQQAPKLRLLLQWVLLQPQQHKETHFEHVLATVSLQLLQEVIDDHNTSRTLSYELRLRLGFHLANKNDKQSKQLAVQYFTELQLDPGQLTAAQNFLVGKTIVENTAENEKNKFEIARGCLGKAKEQLQQSGQNTDAIDQLLETAERIIKPPTMTVIPLLTINIASASTSQAKYYTPI